MTMSQLRSLRRRDFLRLASLAGLAFAVPLLRYTVDTSDRDGAQALQNSIDALGTTVRLKVEYQGSSIEAQAALNSAIDEIARLHCLFTRFDPTSLVGRLNLDGHIEAPQWELFDILSQASHYSERTEGAFDITVKPALDLFENISSQFSPPTDAEFEAARRLIDFERISLSRQFVSFTEANMGITLDCIGKGYVLDRAAEILKEHGITSALVDGSGTLVAVGSRSDGSPWKIGIRDPLHPDGLIGSIFLKDGAVAATGDYENFFTQDRQYYHVIDPTRARSPLYSHSAVVVASNATAADVLAIGSMVKSPREALNLIGQFTGCECLIVTRNNGIVKSNGFVMVP
jgi:FAD:protein FMN transferase